MKFLATRFEKDGPYSEIFDADTWAHAQRICAENDWLLEGINAVRVTGITDKEANQIVDALNEREESTSH
ncbi:hypothetical protein LCGC14_2971550 [marine sediment metagenome]|uniref:Uncharacterized protein n=1 Tax=marine sediment metagenome TaxID=412755 RepID=A0A0F8XA58_9ZZZZ